MRKLTEPCEYGDQTEDQIRDQVIATCSSTGLCKKLFTEPDLTLAKVIEIAQVRETVHHQVKEIDAKHQQPTLHTPSAQGKFAHRFRIHPQYSVWTTLTCQMQKSFHIKHKNS